MVWLDKDGVGLFDGMTKADQSVGDGDADGADETGMMVTFSIAGRRAFCTFA
jgi:hypothetical protein